MSSDLRDDDPTPDGANERERAAHERTTHERTKLERARWAVATIPPIRVRGVLVVEDDPDLQWRLARMLTVRGNRVVGTSSGEAALELIRQWPVDLVLIDDGLPGMSGVELARTLRDQFPDIPVVMMSSTETQESTLAAKLAGAIAVITKPFRPDAIIELLRSFPKGDAELVPAE
ncbi:MAG: response regulator [Sandaracinaceae bacterium]